jgi:2-amino-4-hydroxy-6-hydroxymethyldihydropteridine diphosphokinase
MPIVFLGLGSNLGERVQNIHKAIQRLQLLSSIKLLQQSALIETAPEGRADQHDFINSVIKIETTLAPQELLTYILGVEKSLGRVRKGKWGPRIIDIDILLYDDLVINEKDLIVPHAHLHQRKFVLRSLVELCPDLKHPILKRTMLELLSELNKN